MPAIGPHAPYTVSDGPLSKAIGLSGKTGARIQIHLHETAFEVAEAIEKEGKRPIERLAELGALSDRTQCVHMTQLTDSDIALVAGTGAHIVHCPESNLKLASGLCPAHKLMESGVNLTIGTDGAASNNDLDLFAETGAAAIVAKVVDCDAAALSGHNALLMGTLHEPRALGRELEVGTRGRGRRAVVL